METPDQSQGRVSAAAKTLRILTAPPCMIAWLLVFLRCRGGETFSDTAAYVVAWIGLVLFPLLGYGVWWLVPRLREQGRPGQRKVAFYANFIGYVGCAVYGWTCSGASVRLFFNSYFFTVLLLTVMNALLHVRASGHAASASSASVNRRSSTSRAAGFRSPASGAAAAPASGSSSMITGIIPSLPSVRTVA